MPRASLRLQAEPLSQQTQSLRSKIESKDSVCLGHPLLLDPGDACMRNGHFFIQEQKVLALVTKDGCSNLLLGGV